MLVEHFGEGSATVAAVRGNKAFQGWDLHAMLLRVIANDTRGANWQRGGGKGRKPEMIELPKAMERGRVSKVADLKKALEDKENTE